MEDKKYFIFKKGESLKVSNNFNSNELECRCKLSSCVEQRISVKLVEKLQKVREDLKKSITITSGYRCEAHNKAIGGAPKSQHVLGDAADLKTQDMESLDKLLQKEFMSIGDAKPSFIHVDTRTDTKRRWTY